MEEAKETRRMAAHHVIIDGQDMGQCVVVWHTDGIVVDVHPLTHEEPFTEWVCGSIAIVDGVIQ